MKYEDLKNIKTVQGLIIDLGAIVNLKINILPAVNPFDNSDQDLYCIQLTGKWNGYTIKSDCIFNQNDLDHLEETITFITPSAPLQIN